MIRAVLGRMSPGGARARLSLLIFHRVLPEHDPLFPNGAFAERFDRIIGWLTRWFEVLPLGEAIAGLRSGKLPARAAAITFDDGYADNLTQAVPILLKHRCTAAFFIATDFLDGGRMWNDTVIEALRRCAAAQLDLRFLDLGAHRLTTNDERRAAINNVVPKLKYFSPQRRTEAVQAIAQASNAALPNDLMLTSQQVREMHAAGMTIGAHTKSHPILMRLDDDAAREEVQGSRQKLERILGKGVEFFAYPNGQPGQDYDSRHVRLAQVLGFQAAFSTVWGSAKAQSDFYQLPRFTPWDRTPARFALRMGQNLRRDPQGLVANNT